jgi:hypothetical protein
MTIIFNSGSSQKNQACALLALVASIMSIGTAAQAQSGSENAASVGTLGQQNAGVTSNPNFACAPTSVADGLIYLNNVFGAFSSNPTFDTSYATVNTLATDMGTTSAGTSYGGEVTGLQSYLSSSLSVAIAGGQYCSSLVGSGVPSSLSSIVTSTTPTATFLANGLNTQKSVTMWIQFGTIDGSTGAFTPVVGVHSVTLTSITDVSGNGSISFMDPWGGAVGATKAVTETYSLETLNGFLTLYSLNPVPAGTEPIGLAGEGSTTPLLADSGTFFSGRIIADLDVAVVPEPATYLAGALLLLPFGLTFFRKSLKMQKAVK